MRQMRRSSIIAVSALLTLGASECSISMGEEGTNIPPQSQPVEIEDGAAERTEAIAAVEAFVGEGWQQLATAELGQQAASDLRVYDGSKIQVVGMAAGMVASCAPELVASALNAVNKLEADADAQAAYMLYSEIGSAAIQHGLVDCEEYRIFADNRGATLHPLPDMSTD